MLFVLDQFSYYCFNYFPFIIPHILDSNEDNTQQLTINITSERLLNFFGYQSFFFIIYQSRKRYVLYLFYIHNIIYCEKALFYERIQSFLFGLLRQPIKRKNSFFLSLRKLLSCLGQDTETKYLRHTWEVRPGLVFYLGQECHPARTAVQ